jgi:hypothetical protein
VKAPRFRLFDAAETMAKAADVLSRPPAKAHIVRVQGRGRLVRQFALPIELCPTTNATRHAPKGLNARIKADITTVMLVQTQGRVRMNPLPGRPMIIGIRFSSRQPDRFCNSFKMAIDRLMVGDNRLGYLREDNPDRIDEHQRWEKAPKGDKGFAILEIWSGDP